MEGETTGNKNAENYRWKMDKARLTPQPSMRGGKEWCSPGEIGSALYLLVCIGVHSWFRIV
jgi:hypothetical protein